MLRSRRPAYHNQRSRIVFDGSVGSQQNDRWAVRRPVRWETREAANCMHALPHTSKFCAHASPRRLIWSAGCCWLNRWWAVASAVFSISVECEIESRAKEIQIVVDWRHKCDWKSEASGNKKFVAVCILYNSSTVMSVSRIVKWLKRSEKFALHISSVNNFLTKHFVCVFKSSIMYY